MMNEFLGYLVFFVGFIILTCVCKIALIEACRWNRKFRRVYRDLFDEV